MGKHGALYGIVLTTAVWALKLVERQKDSPLTGFAMRGLQVPHSGGG